MVQTSVEGSIFILIVKDNGFDCGFWLRCSYDIIIDQLASQLNLKDYIYSLGCEV